MLREYEFTMIANGQLPDEEMKKLVQKYEKIILGDKGEVIKKDVWGTKKMAFPINKNFRGHYVHYDLTSDPKDLAEAERLMRIDEDVLRYMSVKLGENVDVNERKAEIAKAEAEAARRQQELQNEDILDK